MMRGVLESDRITKDSDSEALAGFGLLVAGIFLLIAGIFGRGEPQLPAIVLGSFVGVSGAVVVRLGLRYRTVLFDKDGLELDGEYLTYPRVDQAILFLQARSVVLVLKETPRSRRGSLRQFRLKRTEIPSASRVLRGRLGPNRFVLTSSRSLAEFKGGTA